MIPGLVVDSRQITVSPLIAVPAHCFPAMRSTLATVCTLLLCRRRWPVGLLGSLQAQFGCFHFADVPHFVGLYSVKIMVGVLLMQDRIKEWGKRYLQVCSRHHTSPQL